MEFGVDAFDDMLLEPVTRNARASGKFHPKVKPKPRKDLSASVASDVPNATKEKHAKPAATAPNIQNDVLVSSGAASEIRGAKDDSRSSGIVNTLSKLDTKDAAPFENVMPDSGACSARENADIFLGLEVDDFLTQPSSGMVRATSETHHETPNFHASNEDGLKCKSGIPAPGSIESSADMVSKHVRSESHNSDCITKDPAIFMEADAPNNDFELGLGTEERGAISEFESRDTMLGASIASDRLASKLPVNEEPKNHSEKSHLDDNVLEDNPLSKDVPLGKMGAKSRKRKTLSVLDRSQKSKKSSAAGDKGKGGKSSRQPRKGVACELIDESDDEAYDNSEFHTENLSNSAVDEAEDGHDACGDESAPEKKRAPRKKSVVDSEKTVRKRKKVNKEMDQSTNQTPKKFSHSTRRTRRQVDRTLLETPEDELDLTKVPIKDLIMLYLHKERMENKEAKLNKPLTYQSAENETSYYEEETFETERNRDFTDNQEAEAVQMTSPFFNYQSYMDKTRSVKWSRQDDELFYKFGIDLSMIQLLFPDRTRRQIKLKLKKEERQHPLRLSEAVQNRAKDHSHFEMIIEQLKQAAGKAEEELDGSESIGVTGKEDMEELIPETTSILQDEATKPVQNWEDGGNTVTNNPEAEDSTAKSYSPRQFDEIEDDSDINDYRCEY